VDDRSPRWRRRLSISLASGSIGLLPGVVKELNGVHVPCPKCDRLDTASIRRRGRSTFYLHCRQCMAETFITRERAEEMVAQVAPEAVDRLFA
jgi:hypothetical protein